MLRIYLRWVRLPKRKRAQIPGNAPAAQRQAANSAPNAEVPNPYRALHGYARAELPTAENSALNAENPSRVRNGPANAEKSTAVTSAITAAKRDPDGS